MTKLLEIKKAIRGVLERNGYKVYASEVQEGFARPACFVELSQFSSEDINDYIIQIHASFDILYAPADKTHEHLIMTADELNRLFCNLSLEVGDRNLNIDSTDGDIENGFIRLGLDFSFTDEPHNPQKPIYEPAENVQVNINGNKILIEEA